MARKGFLDKLIEENELSTFLQLLNNGKSQKELADIYKTSQPVICQTIKKIKSTNTQQVEPPQEEIKKTPYEILYENRFQIVEWRKQGVYKAEIAKRMGVTDKDVFDFFDKRTRLTGKQIKEIKIAYSNGKSVEAIANQYNSPVETIKKICKATLVSTTNSEISEDIIVDLGCVSEFCKYLQQLQYKVKYTNEDETKIEHKIQDLLHKIEMDDCSDDEALDMVQQIKELRQQRRECKDFLNLVSPIIEFLEQEDNYKVLKDLANIAGRVNNNAYKLNDRIYFLRTKEGE